MYNTWVKKAACGLTKHTDFKNLSSTHFTCFFSFLLSEPKQGIPTVCQLLCWSRPWPARSSRATGGPAKLDGGDEACALPPETQARHAGTQLHGETVPQNDRAGHLPESEIISVSWLCVCVCVCVCVSVCVCVCREYFENPWKCHCCKSFCFWVVASLAELLDCP